MNVPPRQTPHVARLVNMSYIEDGFLLAHTYHRSFSWELCSPVITLSNNALSEAPEGTLLTISQPLFERTGKFRYCATPPSTEPYSRTSLMCATFALVGSCWSVLWFNSDILRYIGQMQFSMSCSTFLVSESTTSPRYRNIKEIYIVVSCPACSTKLKAMDSRG